MDSELRDLVAPGSGCVDDERGGDRADAVVTLQPSPDGAMAVTRAFVWISAWWWRIPRTNA